VAALVPSLVTAQASPLVVQNAWMRKAPGVDSAAVYMVLQNTSAAPVIVVGVRSPVASQVMVHETSVVDGQSRMRAYEKLVIAPGHSVSFSPGGMHVMLSGFTKSVTVGQTVPLTLLLANGGPVQVTVTVRPLDAQ
jgi:copper(I)-binding protein